MLTKKKSKPKPKPRKKPTFVHQQCAGCGRIFFKLSKVKRGQETLAGLVCKDCVTVPEPGDDPGRNVPGGEDDEFYD